MSVKSTTPCFLFPDNWEEVTNMPCQSIAGRVIFILVIGFVLVVATAAATATFTGGNNAAVIGASSAVGVVWLWSNRFKRADLRQ